MTIDSETLYRQLGRLIETMPDLTAHPLSNEAHLWLGRAYALVKEVDNSVAIRFSVNADNLGTFLGSNADKEIKNIIFRCFAITERKAPVSAIGAFIPVGDSFDAFAALSKIFQTATKDVLIIDPYMDGTALTEFGIAIPENVCLRLMTDQASYKADLLPAAKKWVQQYGIVRPLLVRFAPQKTLHDRAIFIDQTAAWSLTQSLKDFAKRSPAEIIRANDTADLKIIAYKEVWDSAQIVI